MKHIALIIAACCLILTACAQNNNNLNVFATSGGSDVKDSYNDLKKAYPQYTWGESRLMN